MENSNNIALFVFLITIATISSITFSNGNMEVLCKESERQALLSFKQDLEDPMNWLSSWVGDGDYCSWTGVSCYNLTGYVHELRLSGYSDRIDEGRGMLGGKINPSLLDLNYLNYLDLSCNYFEGIPIPSFIGSLKSLMHLDLLHAGFGGLIPHQLGNLSNLRYLNLNGYLKVEKLQWISGLTLLQYVDMSRVDMSKAYDWVQVLNTLPSLAELRLSRCDLGNLSPHLPVINFTSLSIFDVSENYHFAPLPNWLFSLKNLNFLDLSGISLGGSFPLGLTNMTNHLKFLDLSGNRLNSTIPQWLGGFNGLETLDLSANELQGNIPASIGNLTSMVSLNLSSNQLTGKIPNSFGNLFRLRELQLSYNQLSGQLTNLLGKSRNLISLFLSSNHLSGSIPTAIGKLSKLRDFDISDNQLNGKLPESFGQLVNLETLYISHNSLEGSVSEIHFSNLTSLKIWHASGNSLALKTSPNWAPPFQLKTLRLNSWHLGPKLPLWLRWQQHLLELQISNASISDTIPTWFCNISSQLIWLNLSHNQFHGPFPCRIIYPMSEIDISSNQFNGSLPSTEIEFLDFSNNSFSGSVTHFFCDDNSFPGTHLNSFTGTHLFLGNNLLSGAIPKCWKKWKYLNILNLENNNLVGVIPSSMGDLTSLNLLNLRNNNLSGELPLSLRNSESMRILDLSGNKFIGKIPEWIGMSLWVLNLRSNNFGGDIPLQLCNLTSLQVLDLAHNDLLGTIPTCVYNLTSLYLLNLRNNRLSGELPLSVTNSTLLNLFDLGGNKFIGKIPEWIGMSLSSLVVLNLRSNNFQGDIPLQLCNLKSLRVLDLAHNNLSGTIPTCFYNLTAMKTSENSNFGSLHTFVFIRGAAEMTEGMGVVYSTDVFEMAEEELVTKGRKFEYGTLLRYVKTIDLSENNLVGEIPVELTNLHLQTLNLSRNHLVGKIPSKIGDMSQLESLDLSQNQLYGKIPASISSLSFLSYLNLSRNNFTGRIPTGTQLQSFNESSYVGNHLCGPPLRQNCSTSDQSIPIAGVKQDSLVSESNLYLSLGLGFAFGFWAILGSLLVNMPWSVAFSRVVDRIVLKLYAFIIEFF